MEGVIPNMGGKKKAAPAKTWTLAGEPVYSQALAPVEERVFKDTFSHFREVASRMREDSDRFSKAVSLTRAGQQASRASIGFFCKHFEGKYQRIDVVKALATASMLPAPSAEQLGTSPPFMLGAVLWLLDYVSGRNWKRNSIRFFRRKWMRRSILPLQMWMTSTIPVMRYWALCPCS